MADKCLVSYFYLFEAISNTYVSQDNTTGTVLYSLRSSVKESDYVCHPNKVITSCSKS